MIIQSKNNLDIQAPITYLTNPEVSGTNVLRWANPNGFNASWAIQVGKTGAQKSEIVILGASTPAGTAGTLTGNTSYDHATDTPIYGIKYDQVVFERSTAGTLGTASPITNGTITIQADSLYTIFDDTTGSTTYAYKTYFRNSVLNVTTSESDWITSAGFSFYSLGKMRQRVKDKLYDSSFIQDDTIINDWINEWLSIMNNTMTDVNEDYAIGTVNVAFASNQELGTITNTDFRGQTKRVWYTDGSGTYQATKMDSNTWMPTTIFNNTAPYYYFQGDQVIGRKPIEAAGTFSIEYQINQPVLVEDTDELPVPMRGYTKSFVDYALSVAKRKDNKTEEGEALENRAQAQLEAFKTQLTPRLRTGSTYVNVVEQVDQDGVNWW